MDVILAALSEQQEELDGLLAALDPAGWETPSRCPGWTVADVVLHLAQTDELVEATVQGRLAEVASRFTADAEDGALVSVDAAAEHMVERQRGDAGPAVHARWRAAAATQQALLRSCDPHRRLAWVADELSARTLATTRLAEAWIHTGDVAEGLGCSLAPTGRLWHIARLAWRTLPYAFARAGRTLNGPVALQLTAPDGSTWDFREEAEANTVLRGRADELCLVAGRRLDPAGTGLVAEGPDGEAVLALLRTYA